MKILIKNGRVIDPASKLDRTCDVAIAAGRIVSVGDPGSFSAAKVIDASGCLVLPGLVDLAARLREPVTRALSDAGIAVSEEKLGRICQVSASETFVIRRLNEARIEGEVLVQDFCHLPLYRIYREYFEQSPEIVAKAFGIAINTAASDLAARRDADKN